MRIVLFVHSLVSDWNHGNAHFLRGLMRALEARGHETIACERWHNWSADNLYQDHGSAPFIEFARKFPDLTVQTYSGGPALREEMDVLTRGADVVIVHEFNPPELINTAADLRHERNDFILLFHDSHHRMVSAPQQMAMLQLQRYDGILAFGESLARLYRVRAPGVRVMVFHEAADTTVFRPLERKRNEDVVWIGNWGDEERTPQLESYLIGVARQLPQLRFRVHGVRYPEQHRRAMREAGIVYGGYLPNHRVPEVYARARVTLHLPRAPYVEQLPGIPTIRPFEALACGIPLVSLPWPDTEGLFRAGKDYMVVHTPAEMRDALVKLTNDAGAREALIANGLQTIHTRHTCRHRAEQLEVMLGAMATAAA